mmetsp:Transcript_68496/g.164494  ORF Transcript_68496/g.164494 Transcript_68496/m.164494 type:complete len:627 (+) Transcript_68496:63-1943(+)
MKRRREDAEVVAPLRVAVVGGAGHVGLPLSLLLADRGYSVDILDKDEAKLEQLKQGVFPFLERGGPELLEKCRGKPTLNFTSDASVVASADCIILTIGTPIDEHLNPAMHAVFNCIDDLKVHARQGQTYILRSTLFPGTTQRVADQLADSGISAGVCFCPERIAQGYAVQELQHLPQIISGTTAGAIEVAAQLFGSFGVELIEMGVMEAEVAKLFLNAWRYIHFATANQFYVLAEERGLDFTKIRQACCYKYPRASSMPTAGLTAGPCLFKDSMVLASFARHSSSLCHAAMLINETMPEVIVAKAKEMTPLRNKSVGLLGMAFKGGSDDVRDSLAYKVRRLLNYEGANVMCTDVLVAASDFVSLEVASSSPVVILTCPHSEYKHLKFSQEQVVIDCWGFWAPCGLKIHSPPTAAPLVLSEHKKRYLVSGCHTRVGVELVQALLARQQEVWAYDARRGSDRPAKLAEDALPEKALARFHFLSASSNNGSSMQSEVEQVLHKHSIDIAIAAHTVGADDSECSTAASLAEDLQRVCTVIDASAVARRDGASLERFVLISSSDGAVNSVSAETRPQSLQSSLAAAAEAAVRRAGERDGLPFVIARPSRPVSSCNGDVRSGDLLGQLVQVR